MVVGICVGETSLTEVTFISEKMPQVGEYVSMTSRQFRKSPNWELKTTTSVEK